MSVYRFLLLGVVCLGVAVCVTLLCSQPASFHGHTNRVCNVVASPDGKTLASVSKDQTIKLWNVATRKERAAIRGLAADTWGLAFSPDGATLASGGRGTAIQLWDVVTGEERVSFQGRPGSVWPVAFSPDGKTLATGSNDCAGKLWDVATGTERAALRGHVHRPNSFAFSPDGKTLASSADDKTVKLWDVATGKERAALQGHPSNVVCVTFSPDGKTLASSSWDCTVNLWDAATGERRFLNAWWLGEGSADYVTELCFSPDGKTLAGSAGDRVAVWDVASGENRANYRRGLRLFHLSLSGILQCLDLCPNDWEVIVDSLGFTPDGKLVALGSDRQTVKRWEASAIPVKPIAVLGGLGAAVLFLAAAACLRSLSRRFPKKKEASDEPGRAVARPPCRARRPAVAGANSAVLLRMRDGLAVALVVLAVLMAYSRPR